MAPLRLASHVHACRVAEHVILLDLKRNKYLGVSAPDCGALAQSVRDWPAARTATASCDAIDTELLDELIAAGILVHDDERPDRFARSDRSAVSRPSVALIEGYSHVDARMRLFDLGSFLIATLRARLLLSLRSLEHVVAGVNARRGRAEFRFDPEHVRRLVHLHARMRTFLFTSRDECLFDSLVLIEFLALYRIFPNWVFGVEGRPFSAHCWLQHEDVVINDAPDHVNRYTPIMTI